MTAAGWRMAADAVLVVHAGFVAFVVVGLALVVAGGARGWAWVRNPWFRFAHLSAIGVVVVQAWCGVICPLTTLEMALRRRAGDATYAGGFLAHWVERALYWNAPPWVFAVLYTAFAVAVVGTWIRVRPRRFRGRRGPG
jgi:polyferredoxin